MPSVENQRTKITAHRGASSLAPENTLAAMRKAIEIGADYAELDVHLSKDGIVVLLHDDTLNRTTNDSGPVFAKTLEELKRLDAGGWFGEKFRKEPIPTLEEVIHLVDKKMKLNIEIKISGNEPDIAEKVIALIRQNHFEDQCMITSFDHETVRKVESLAPDLRTGLIIGKNYVIDPFSGPWDVISSNYKNVNQEFVQKARQVGKAVHVWTVNDTFEMRRLINLGVESIITNYPNILKALLEETGNE